MSRRTIPALTRLQVIEALPGEFGQRIVVLPWWRELVMALDAPALVLLIVLLTRQAGKSQGALSAAVSELFTRRGAYVLYVAAAEHQAAAVFERKLRGPLSKLLAAQGIAASAVKFTRRGVEVSSLGSALEIIATNEATAPGRSPTLLILDEARDIPDTTFTALVPSVIGAGGKVLIVSTPGPPRGFFYELVQQAASSPEIWLHRSAENENPHASRSVLDFLRRKLGVLFPAAMRRELEGEFAESGDELLPVALIESAIDDCLGELPAHDGPAYAFLDLGRKRDLTSLVAVVSVAPRRPEAADHLLVASVRVWNPRDSATGEVDFAEVRAALERLPVRFPSLRQVLVDEGAEAGSILPWTRAHPALSLRVSGFTGNVSSNMELWGALLARLNAQTLSVPRHERLLTELRGLRREEFAFGSKWRVVDASRKFHRDVSLALAGACFAAVETLSACEVCGRRSSECSGLHLLPYDGPVVGHAAARQQAPDARLRGFLEHFAGQVDASDLAGAEATWTEIEQYVAAVERVDATAGARARALLARVERAAAQYANA